MAITITSGPSGLCCGLKGGEKKTIIIDYTM